MDQTSPRLEGVPLETDALSPGEAEIEKVKSRPRSAFHFGLKGVLWLMIGSSILVALPQGLGWDYFDFLSVWILLIYGCMPLIAWTVFLLIPARLGVWRWLVAGLIGAAIVLPAWIGSAIDGSLLEVILGSLYFWVPQAGCIAVVQYLLFSNRRTNLRKR